MMRTSLAVCALYALLTVPCAAQTADAPDHAVRSMSFTLNAPASRAVRAFGPLEERRWNPGWSPQFVYPGNPRAVAGAVFYTGKHTHTIWLLHDYDEAGHFVQYVTVAPDASVAVLSIRVEDVSPASSRATVTVEVTALGEAGRAHVADVESGFSDEAPHWQSAINAYLAQSPAP